jgi:DNA polymerase-1
MEHEGFRVDRGILKQLQTQFNEQSESLAKRIYETTGETFNILSPKQLGEVLFEKLGLPTGRKNKSGFSTDADTLEALADKHPAIPLILEYRFITKLKSTFVDGLLNVVSETNDRVRTQFNQCVTATGRISSTEPNMQNIPVRTQQGREIRKAFVASEGNVLVDADYSQIELRLLAHISGDEGMIAAFNSGKDIHRTTASEVFRVPFEEVTSEQRSAAKAVNFGIVYGISDFGLARNLDIPVKRAGEYIKLYFDRYPGVKSYLEKSVEDAKHLGYAITMFERRRALPELKSSNYNTRSFGERVAMNMPIQGTAADIIKLAMVEVNDALQKRGLKTKLILQVHDELIFDVPKAEEDEVVTLVHESMEQVAKLSVPLDADVKVGHSWYETK